MRHLGLAFRGVGQGKTPFYRRATTAGGPYRRARDDRESVDFDDQDPCSVSLYFRERKDPRNVSPCVIARGIAYAWAHSIV